MDVYTFCIKFVQILLKIGMDKDWLSSKLIEITNSNQPMLDWTEQSKNLHSFMKNEKLQSIMY